MAPDTGTFEEAASESGHIDALDTACEEIDLFEHQLCTKEAIMNGEDGEVIRVGVTAGFLVSPHVPSILTALRKKFKKEGNRRQRARSAMAAGGLEV
ncbi:hypothetical protein B0A48_14043 [Cryoendolithus antarcticus]|uniref:Uncharacterized protein n=1 Tax=Cryoendolithus antarcticus TaxID=1507870 RepID=A0A1V8SM56_9PEZI|nr:hypothetical protein B0A48_14043 [Cryoendolithus antarcticus]